MKRLASFFWFFVASSLPAFAESPPPEANAPDRWIVSLEQFGPLKSPAQAQSAWQAARQLLKDHPGIILAPPQAWSMIKPGALQSLIRTPAPPEQTKQWKQGPGTIVLTTDRERPVLELPPLSGLKLEREVRLDDGDSVPHWGTHPMLQLDSRIIYGSISYLDWIQAPVEKGRDRRFYVPTVRGLVPGQFINVHGGPGYGGGVTRACIKSLGYDPVKQLHYFIADTDRDHVAGAIAQNKSNNGLIHMTQNSHADNQTYDVKVIRNQYAHGDTYMYYCDFNYMSNIHSAAGDENGNCYGAFIRSLENRFKGTVESIDWSTNRLTFANGASGVDTLGDSRPLINLNPVKQINAGKVIIVAGRSEFDLPDTKMSIFEGKDYSTHLIKNPVTGNKERQFGGLIRGDKDCGWNESVVGRYFALSEPSEKTPKGNFRWYLITAYHANADGAKEIEIQRFWWGAKSAGSPTLYRPENYTWDGHVHPLSYVIAPGAYVNDVSRALSGGDRGGQRILGLAPHSAQNTEFDFAKGDPVEQAIGPDPFKPEVLRSWMWEDVPGQYPAAVFDIANYGATSRYSVLSIAGGPADLDEVSKRHQPKPAWDNLLVMNSAATTGLNLKADFANAAILFQQPHHEQAIKWHFYPDTSAPKDNSNAKDASSNPPVAPQVASLTVNRTSGEFQFQGGGLQSGGSVSGVAGLSGDAHAAKNLRGKNLPVVTGATSVRITFPQPEADGDYAVFVEQSWLTNRAITEKGPQGFTIEFAAGPPDKGGALDWMIVR